MAGLEELYKHVYGFKINGKVVSRNSRSNRVNIRLNERDIRGRIKVGNKNVISREDKFR